MEALKNLTKKVLTKKYFDFLFHYNAEKRFLTAKNDCPLRARVMLPEAGAGREAGA